MSPEEDIFMALKETLQRTGTLDNVRGILRADIYHCLNDSMEGGESESKLRPAPPQENVLINEIIANYLAFNGYENTLSVLAAECGTPSLMELYKSNDCASTTTESSIMLGSNFIRVELGLSIDSTISSERHHPPLAIMYEIVETLKTRARSRSKAA